MKETHIIRVDNFGPNGNRVCWFKDVPLDVTSSMLQDKISEIFNHVYENFEFEEYQEMPSVATSIYNWARL